MNKYMGIDIEIYFNRKDLKKHLDMQTKKWVYEENPLCAYAELKPVLEALLNTNIAYRVAMSIAEGGILDLIPDFPSRLKAFIDKTEEKLDE